jgi:WD40-like Beta Propeller Repeat
MMSIPRGQLELVCCVLLAAACEHSSAVEPDPYPPAPPFSALLPRRLTFNTGDDRTPAWLADGSGIVYSTERQDRIDHDRCLAVLPPEGGTIQATHCQLNPIHDDSTDLMESPAVNAAGALFFHRVVSWVGQQKLGSSALMLGSADRPVEASVLRALPYTAPNGRLHSTIRGPRWIGVDSVVYLAEQLFYEGSTFYPDTFTTGLDVVLVDLSEGEPRFEVVPGTDYASGVDVSDNGASLYYTLGGDSRVYRRELASGAVTTVLDFGAGNIVRDVQVRGNTLVAILGRSVLYRFEEAHGYVQRDEGGDLVMVNLSTSETSRFSTDTVLFRHPAISPDGARVVVETQPYDTVHHQRVSEYNAPNHRADLWLFGLEAE